MDKIARIKNEVKLREWSEMIQACKSSGLTIIPWCENSNLNIKTYRSFQHFYGIIKVMKSERKRCFFMAEINLDSMSQEELSAYIKVLRAKVEKQGSYHQKHERNAY